MCQGAVNDVYGSPDELWGLRIVVKVLRTLFIIYGAPDELALRNAYGAPDEVIFNCCLGPCNPGLRRPGRGNV